MRKNEVPEINGYTFNRKLGVGAYANVYQVTDKATKREVAVKYFKLQITANIHHCAAREIIILKTINHKNIIEMESFGFSKERVFMVLEYARFGPLNSFLCDHKHFYQNEPFVKQIMSQIISGLTYLHQFHMYHGDLKPDNIVITEFDRRNKVHVKLIDFGLSDVYGPDIEHHANRGGSIYYLAPERLLGFPFDYTCDMFSLGVIMYEVLFENKPFPTVPVEIHFAFIKKRTPIKYPDTIYNFSREAIDLLQNLLSYDRLVRYKNGSLINHPFLEVVPPPKLEPVNYLFEANYISAEAKTLLKKREFDMAFFGFVGAIFNLKLHITFNLNGEEEAMNRRYFVCKINEYMSYVRNLDETYLRPKRDPVVTDPDMETMKTIFKNTPGLYHAVESGFIGEMYVKEKNYQGIKILRNALDYIMKHISAEPEGNRKYLLGKKIDEWLGILESFESKNGFVA